VGQAAVEGSSTTQRGKIPSLGKQMHLEKFYCLLPVMRRLKQPKTSMQQTIFWMIVEMTQIFHVHFEFTEQPCQSFLMHNTAMRLWIISFGWTKLKEIIGQRTTTK
jgi:hypothetical protein